MSLAYSLGGNIGEIKTGIKCDEGTVLLEHRRKDPDAGQVVPEEVSLGRSLPEQMGKALAHRGLSACRGMREGCSGEDAPG